MCIRAEICFPHFKHVHQQSLHTQSWLKSEHIYWELSLVFGVLCFLSFVQIICDAISCYTLYLVKQQIFLQRMKTRINSADKKTDTLECDPLGRVPCSRVLAGLQFKSCLTERLTRPDARVFGLNETSVKYTTPARFKAANQSLQQKAHFCSWEGGGGPGEFNLLLQRFPISSFPVSKDSSWKRRTVSSCWLSSTPNSAAS